MPNNKKKSMTDIIGDNANGSNDGANAENVHPNSRKAKQMLRSMMRDEKLQVRKRQQKSKIKPKVDRFSWFKYRLDADKTVLSKQELLQLIQEFIDRNDAEIMQGETEQVSLEQIENMIVVKRMETEEFRKSGFEVPDLMNGQEIKKLREWDGDYNGMHRLKTIKMFPPISLLKATVTTAEITNNLLHSAQNNMQGEASTAEDRAVSNDETSMMMMVQEEHIPCQEESSNSSLVQNEMVAEQHTPPQNIDVFMQHQQEQEEQQQLLQQQQEALASPMISTEQPSTTETSIQENEQRMEESIANAAQFIQSSVDECNNLVQFNLGEVESAVEQQAAAATSNTEAETTAAATSS